MRLHADSGIATTLSSRRNRQHTPMPALSASSPRSRRLYTQAGARPHPAFRKTKLPRISGCSIRGRTRRFTRLGWMCVGVFWRRLSMQGEGMEMPDDEARRKDGKNGCFADAALWKTVRMGISRCPTAGVPAPRIRQRTTRTRNTCARS
jgi:hypothetical protein